MTKKILGIDCSSTTIGWCLLETDGYNITHKTSGYIKPKKKGLLIDRLADTRKAILDLFQKTKPDYIGIEEIVQFMKNKSTAKTIIMLTTFNRMVALCAYDYLNKSPEFFSVMAIRHGIKNGKIFPQKKDIPELVSKHLGITFTFEKNRNGKIKEENYDRADGMAVALYYAFILNRKISKKTATKKRCKKRCKKK